MLDTLEDWTKPKSDEIAAFTQLKALNQGNKTLSNYIQEVRRMVNLCNFTCVGDCKDRLIRNSIVTGLSSSKAQLQCISKGSSLTLSECIIICHTEDATCRQVQALHLQSTVYRLWGQYSNPQTNPILPAMRQAKSQRKWILQGWQTQPQGWPSHKELAPERLQTQSQDCIPTMWLRSSQIKGRVCCQ